MVKPGLAGRGMAPGRSVKSFPRLTRTNRLFLLALITLSERKLNASSCWMRLGEKKNWLAPEFRSGYTLASNREGRGMRAAGIRLLANGVRNVRAALAGTGPMVSGS